MIHYVRGAVMLAQIDRETLGAVLSGARTSRDVAAALGLKSRSSAHARISRCRAAGLVDYQPGLDGTLHPLFRIVWNPPTEPTSPARGPKGNQ